MIDECLRELNPGVPLYGFLCLAIGVWVGRYSLSSRLTALRRKNQDLNYNLQAAFLNYRELPVKPLRPVDSNALIPGEYYVDRHLAGWSENNIAQHEPLDIGPVDGRPYCMRLPAYSPSAHGIVKDPDLPTLHTPQFHFFRRRTIAMDVWEYEGIKSE